MEKQNKKGFFEWIVVLGGESDPESSLPIPLYEKPDPPCKRRKRRYVKSTQTDFRKTFPKTLPKTSSITVQTDPNPPPNPPNSRLVIVFISGMIAGIILKKYIKPTYV